MRCNLLVGLSVVMAFAVVSSRVHADDAPPMELHEWSVWVGEPQAKQINALTDYISAMPGVVETDRGRRSEKSAPSPVSVMTIYGEPPEVVDIDLRITGGRP